MHIAELAIHPLKSARPVRVTELPLTPLGPARDRRWMLVDATGRFLSQRTHPRLCLVVAEALPDGALHLAAPGMPALQVPPAAGESVTVEVWQDRLEARATDPDADAWCSDYLGLPVRLVFLPEQTVRAVDPRFAGPGHRTAFSDGFPLLLVTQASLVHLNERLRAAGTPAVDWRRFRPNVVVAGDLPPHAEDGWRRLRVGGIELALVKPCSRCVVPAIDPDTGVKDGQILTILRSYRSGADGRVYFGQNVVSGSRPPGAVLRAGDAVEILE